jgi:prepilin-type N-terminal cleavage/methylation domain-containing protein/prepilin-type processing-associated H-X9-DG protein
MRQLTRLRRQGLTILECVVTIAIVALLGSISAVGVMQLRQTAARTQCGNQLRQIGIALHEYHNTYKRLPSGVIHPRLPRNAVQIYGPDADPYPLSTWHMRVIPFLEYESLWQSIESAYSRDSRRISDPPHWAREVTIALYQCPSDSDRPHAEDGPNPGLTSYVGVAGMTSTQRDGVFFLDSALRFSDISDGLGYTLAVGERPPTQDRVYGRWYAGWGHWGKVNTYLGVREMASGEYLKSCPDGPYHFGPGRLEDPCSAFHNWSFHFGGANFLLADGSVRFLGYGADALLPALATRAGNDEATLPD